MLDREVFIVDGQHRLNAFQASGHHAVYADVRWHYFESMAEMAQEFVQLNSYLVRLRPDDILRGLEQSNVHLQRIRKQCCYVGYSSVRRTIHSPILSMSTLLRVWFGTRADVPVMWGSALLVAEQLDLTETGALIEFVQACFEAWHRDVEYARLWGSLNLILCGWLWRHVVKGEERKGQSRSDRLSVEQFKRGMMSLSATTDYLEWLVGRRISDHDRAPAYNRLKAVLAQRYMQDTKAKLRLPSPGWAKG